jgi:hypothetical protein
MNIQQPFTDALKLPNNAPDKSTRQAYITLWNDQLQTEMRLSPEDVNQIVMMTEGFSFAYLKELFLSSMISWMGTMTTTRIEQIMVAKIAVLREQMNSTNASSKITKELAPAKK